MKEGGRCTNNKNDGNYSNKCKRNIINAWTWLNCCRQTLTASIKGQSIMQLVTPHYHLPTKRRNTWERQSVGRSENCCLQLKDVERKGEKLRKLLETIH